MPRKSSNLLKRRLKIAELVDRQGEIKVDDLSAMLGVSGVTIRGDLSYLEQQGYLKRSFGGAIATSPPASAETTTEAVKPPALSLALRLEIARHCARMVAHGDTIFLGYGEICRTAIPFLSHVSRLRLIVNDLQHALLAEQYIEGEIVVAGEELIRPLSLLTGETLTKSLQQQRIDCCFLEASIHHASGDLMIDQPLLAPHYQRCLNQAQRATAIVTRFGEAGGPQTPLGNLSQIKHLVTTRDVNEHYQPLLTESGFSILYSNNECFTWSNHNLADE